MPHKNFKLIIEYDGTGLFGWQRQKDKPTIQGEIEAALSRILNQPITIAGSGRTDAGVHAYGQVASFHAHTNLSPQTLKKGLNSLIKKPIVIQDCQVVPIDFHAQYSAVSKEYHYYILNRKDPRAIGSIYHWHIRHPLNLESMNQCCDLLRGTFDFKSFENTGSPRSSTVRTILKARISKSEKDVLVFKIRASGFLKYMVRNITGTLVQAGLNKISPDEFKAILNACDRTTAGPTAPAQGLFLYNVAYS